MCKASEHSDCKKSKESFPGMIIVPINERTIYDLRFGFQPRKTHARFCHCGLQSIVAAQFVDTAQLESLIKATERV